MQRGPGSDRNRYEEASERRGRGGNGGYESREPRGRYDEESRDYPGESPRWSAGEESGREAATETADWGERGREGDGGSSERGFGEPLQRGTRRRSQAYEGPREYGRRAPYAPYWGEREGSERERLSRQGRRSVRAPSYRDLEGPRGDYDDRYDPRGRGELHAWPESAYREAHSPHPYRPYGPERSAEGWEPWREAGPGERERRDVGWPRDEGLRSGQGGTGSPWGWRQGGGETAYGTRGSGERERESGPYRGKGPKGYRRSDERIREDVCERMEEHPGLDASEIEVQVAEGEVTLTGAVSDRHQKRIAEDCAEDVSGVKDVTNRIRVRKGGASGSGSPERQEPAGASGSGS
jgi:hypothetical protein